MTRSQRPSVENRVFNIDKAPSVTSYGVVEAVKRLFAATRVGHAGSLDPFATGVLLVCTGRATKITRFLMELEKEYSGTIRLGVETDTDDATGKVVFQRDGFSVSVEELNGAVSSLRGRILQHPPRVSALKRRGRRFYEMARNGESFETEAREITVHDFRVSEFRFPEIDFVLRCSKGTYVRAVARDLGKMLGCGAHLGVLRRVSVGGFTIRNSVCLEELREFAASPRDACAPPGAVSMDEALSFLPGYHLREGGEESLLCGRSPSLDEFDGLAPGVPPEGFVRILSSGGELLAIGRTSPPEREGLVKLEKVLAARINRPEPAAWDQPIERGSGDEHGTIG